MSLWMKMWVSDLKTDNDYGLRHAEPFSDQRTGGQEDEWNGITKRIQGNEESKRISISISYWNLIGRLI